ncbi:MAG: hypothetical protein K1X92_15255 [Bacteroidia bacterium]|nr:hypothetical protein [Bacteroidia bacterium]
MSKTAFNTTQVALCHGKGLENVIVMNGNVSNSPDSPVGRKGRLPFRGIVLSGQSVGKGGV